MAADTTWHLLASVWYWEGEAQGALEGRTRGMRSGWREGQPGTVERCEAGRPSVPPCHAMAPHMAWERFNPRAKSSRPVWGTELLLDGQSARRAALMMEGCTSTLCAHQPPG